MRLFIVLVFLFLFTGTGISQSCDATGNVLLFSNYDGGHLKIRIDENIPNIKIGIASYEPTRISIFGPFAYQVKEVVYAGFSPNTPTGNFHCDSSIAITTLDPGLTLSSGFKKLEFPPVTLLATVEDTIFPGFTQLAGNNTGILGCTSCSLTKATGGANNFAQVIDFFGDYFGSPVRFIKTRYGCWCDTLNCSLPVSCCQEITDCFCKPSSAKPSLSVSGSICSDSLVLRAPFVKGANYQWYRNGLPYIGQISDSLVLRNNVSLNGIYQVFVQEGAGNCAFSDSIPVFFAAKPEYQALVKSAECNNSTTGSIQLTGALTGATIEWFDAAGQTLGNNKRISNLLAGKYSLVIKYGQGCVAFDSFFVANPPALLVQAQASDAQCATKGLGKILLGISGGIPPYQIQVNKGPAGKNADLDLPPGAYEITVQDTLNCTKVLDSLVILPAPELKLSLEGPNAVLLPGDTFNLIATVNKVPGLVKFQWSPTNGLFCTDCPATKGLALLPTTYTLSALDQEGCTASASWEVLVDNKLIYYAPNIFWPDANDSRNTVFGIYPGAGVEKLLDFKVFDRWGNLIHVQTEAWDGRYNGKACPQGVYSWLAQLKMLNGSVFTVKGSVTLVR